MPTSELSARLRFSRTFVLACAAAIVSTVTPTSVGQEQDADQHAGVALFESKIRTILVQHCYKCHSAKAKELQAGLYLDSPEGLRRGGDSGPVIDGNRPTDSLLLQALRYEDPEMPPDGKLPDQVIDDFARWVRMGAPDPRTQEVPQAHHRINWNEARQFWSFRKPIRHPLPKVQHH